MGRCNPLACFGIVICSVRYARGLVLHLDGHVLHVSCSSLRWRPCAVPQAPRGRAPDGRQGAAGIARRVWAPLPPVAGSGRLSCEMGLAHAGRGPATCRLPAAGREPEEWVCACNCR